MGSYSNARKLTAVERELAYRRRVYPRWIAEGKMTADKARLEVAIFQEIAADYAAKVADDEPSLIEYAKEPPE